MYCFCISSARLHIPHTNNQTKSRVESTHVVIQDVMIRPNNQTEIERARHPPLMTRWRAMHATTPLRLRKLLLLLVTGDNRVGMPAPWLHHIGGQGKPNPGWMRAPMAGVNRKETTRWPSSSFSRRLAGAACVLVQPWLAGAGIMHAACADPRAAGFWKDAAPVRVRAWFTWTRWIAKPWLVQYGVVPPEVVDSTAGGG